jgi:hypothetical protein
MILELFLFTVGILVLFSIYFKQKPDPLLLGDVTLGALEHTDSIAYIYYDAADCSNCTTNFTTTITYADGEIRVVHGIWTTSKAEVIFARSDSARPIKPVKFDVEAYQSNPLGKSGKTAKHTYLFN